MPSAKHPLDSSQLGPKPLSTETILKINLFFTAWLPALYSRAYTARALILDDSSLETYIYHLSGSAREAQQTAVRGPGGRVRGRCHPDATMHWCSLRSQFPHFKIIQ